MSIFTLNSETDFTLQQIQSKTSKTFLEELQGQEKCHAKFKFERKTKGSE